MFSGEVTSLCFFGFVWFRSAPLFRFLCSTPARTQRHRGHGQDIVVPVLLFLLPALRPRVQRKFPAPVVGQSRLYGSPVWQSDLEVLPPAGDVLWNPNDLDAVAGGWLSRTGARRLVFLCLSLLLRSSVLVFRFAIDRLRRDRHQNNRPGLRSLWDQHLDPSPVGGLDDEPPTRTEIRRDDCPDRHCIPSCHGTYALVVVLWAWFVFLSLLFCCCRFCFWSE